MTRNTDPTTEKQASSPAKPKLRVTTQIVRRYYVEYPRDAGIFGGPFDTKEEAEDCLRRAQAIGL